MTTRLFAALTLMVVTTACAAPTSPASSTPAAAESLETATCAGRGTAAGTYLFTADDTMTVPATITIPDGWDGCGLIAKEFGPPAGPAIIGFWEVENAYANPCHWNGGQMVPPVDSTAADLAIAMVSQEITEAEPPSEAALGGIDASYVRLTVPDDASVSDCDAVEIPEFRFWKGPGEELTGSAVWWIGAADARGLIGEVWAADVEGTRVVVQAAYFSDATQDEVDEIHAIIESITINH